jgi:phosphonate transport system permease protein
MTLIAIVFLVTMNTDGLTWQALPQFGYVISTMFFQPKLIDVNWGSVLSGLMLTLGITFITTVVATVLSVFISMFAAKNMAFGRWTKVIKPIAAGIRAVPTILWVLVFSVSTGLGATAAILGLNFHGVGYLTKAFTEEYEEVDPGTLEALEATGAGKLQKFTQGILPEVWPAMLTWIFLRFEINFANAVAVGAAAGAGGIGYDLFVNGNFTFDWHMLGTLTYIVLIAMMLFELTSLRLRKKYVRRRD